MSPWQLYQRDLATGNILPDPTQALSMQVLDQLYQNLLKEIVRRRGINQLLRKPKTPKGCYLWGDVGTGKSYLLNTFFQALPFAQKKRLHFHEFMQQVHEQLRQLQGQTDPLKRLARQWAKEAYVLCLDEFLVKDIADAMILANLLQALFSAGVCLVTTANIAPQNLYQDGLQRERFLPAIKLLEQQVAVIEVDNNIDYRRMDLNTLSLASPPVAKSVSEQEHYALTSLSCIQSTGELNLQQSKNLVINDRVIHCINYHDATIWFNFKDLCATRTGTTDYLVIAKRFKIVGLNNIPVLTEQPVDVILRFINLIDVLYDAHTQIIIVTEVPIDELYQHGKLAFEFKRTASRLIEMQTAAYRDTINES